MRRLHLDPWELVVLVLAGLIAWVIGLDVQVLMGN
jgi:hypothetical protein